MSPRTLSKLSHLDGTLTLESIANIYTRLVLLRNLKFVGNEIMEEEQRLKDSLFRIMKSAATVPQSMTDDVVDELEHQLWASMSGFEPMVHLPKSLWHSRRCI